MQRADSGDGGGGVGWQGVALLWRITSLEHAEWA
jgi:hypothetical protein